MVNGTHHIKMGQFCWRLNLTQSYIIVTSLSEIYREQEEGIGSIELTKDYPKQWMPSPCFHHTSNRLIMVKVKTSCLLRLLAASFNLSLWMLYTNFNGHWIDIFQCVSLSCEDGAQTACNRPSLLEGSWFKIMHTASSVTLFLLGIKTLLCTNACFTLVK